MVLCIVRACHLLEPGLRDLLIQDGMPILLAEALLYDGRHVQVAALPDPLHATIWLRTH